MNTPITELSEQTAAQATELPAMYGRIDFSITPERFTIEPGDETELAPEYAERRPELLANKDRVALIKAYTMHGDPVADAFWDLGAASGEVSLAVPSTASFSLTAQTRSGNVRVDMPITIEEQSRRFLRARVGDGKAHVNVETKSGNIRVLQGGAI